jgi:hypothetical protein
MKQRDIIFKLGLALQLLLIPIALLWRFSQEENYYNWIISASFIVVMGLFFWPQTLLGRLKRLSAIKLQFTSTLILLSASWIAYLYFHHYVVSHDIHYAVYSVHWESIFHSRWVMLLGPGVSPLTAIIMTFAVLALPCVNLYRYQLDRKRINGIKKDDLFV